MDLYYEFLLGIAVPLLCLAVVLLGILISSRRAAVLVKDPGHEPLGTGGPELINFTELRSIKTDSDYDPRGDADEQDSVELDAHKEDRIRSVVRDTQTRTRVDTSSDKGGAPRTRAMPWPSNELKQNVELDEKRKTRLRELVRHTQS